MIYPYKPDRWSSHETILRLAGVSGGRWLLDVGAGAGFLARRLTDAGWKVTTVDRLSTADLSLDLTGPLPDPALCGVYDTIVCADVLEHLVDPLRVLRWLSRLLLVEGRLIVSVPNVAHLWARWTLATGRWREDDRGIFDRTHLHYYTGATLEALLRQAGFRVLSRTATAPPIGPRWQGHVARLWPTLFGYQWVVVAEPLRRPMAVTSQPELAQAGLA